MSELSVKPSEAASCNWADGGTYPSTDPGAPARLAGFKPKDYPVAGVGAIVPAEDHNFLWRLGMEMLTWIRDMLIRQFEDVGEAITATTVRNVFQVMPTDAMTARGTEVFTVTGTGTGSTYVGDPCTDGEQIYYYDGGGYIIAADPADGSEIWDNNDMGATSISVVCTDGMLVYALGDSGAPGLHSMSRTKGDVDGNAGTYYGGTKMATNGAYCAAIETSAGAGTVAVYSGIQGTIVQDGNYATGSTGLKAVAMDKDNAYAGGIQSTYDVWAVTLSTHALNWRITLPTTTAPTIEGIAADGNRVFVVSDSVTLTAGGGANLFALDRMTGALLWSLSVAGGADLEGVCTDGRYLYCSDSGDDLYIIDTLAGPAHVCAAIADVTNPVCDGVSVIGNTNLNTELTRVWTVDALASFRRVAGTDTERRPLYTLAMPLP